MISELNKIFIIVLVTAILSIVFLPNRKIHQAVFYFGKNACFLQWGNYPVGSKVWEDQMSLPENERIPYINWICFTNNP